MREGGEGVNEGGMEGGGEGVEGGEEKKKEKMEGRQEREKLQRKSCIPPFIYDRQFPFIKKGCA